MTIGDVSEVLMSAEKFKQLYDSIQALYVRCNELQESIYSLDYLLGTAIKDSVQIKKLNQQAIKNFERGFNAGSE